LSEGGQGSKPTTTEKKAGKFPGKEMKRNRRMSKPKLLTCPFCGSKSSLTEFDDLAGKLDALRNESEERTARLDALEAYVLLAKSNGTNQPNE
jgi:hypothetical protein